MNKMTVKQIELIFQGFVCSLVWGLGSGLSLSCFYQARPLAWKQLKSHIVSAGNLHYSQNAAGVQLIVVFL